MGFASENIAPGTLLRIVLPSLRTKELLPAELSDPESIVFHIERAKELVPIEARSKNMVSHLSRGSSASFGSSKLHSSKLLSFGVQLEEEL